MSNNIIDKFKVVWMKDVTIKYTYIRHHEEKFIILIGTFGYNFSVAIIMVLYG